MIRIEARKILDSKYEVRIAILGTGAIRPNEFYFHQEVCNETHAQLLSESLWRGLHERLEEIKKDAYETGYAVGRGHKRKQIYFYGDFNVDVNCFQR